MVLSLAASAVFSLYVANVDSHGSSYGSLVTAVTTRLWICVTTSEVLFGAEVDACRTDRPGVDSA